jgi:cytochrome c oxidase assembly protein subunit 15
MGGRLVPAELLRLDGVARNFMENPIAVQWLHRVVGTLLAVAVITLFARVQRARPDRRSRRLNAALLGLIGTQYLLGVLTLIHLVPVTLAVVHQAMALVIFGVWLSWLHHVRNLRILVEPSTGRAEHA